MATQNQHPEIWQRLLAQALTLIDDIALRGHKNIFWTFGGGTVLMLRFNHRKSKDIDIFFADPQPLGFVTPRLSDTAENLTTDYVEAASYVKLFLPEGEIDFVASPNLTTPGYVIETVMGRKIRMETSVEIIAKKMWHRGHAITARDIFDYALVSERDHENLMTASNFLLRHADEILQDLKNRATPLAIQFDAIETLDYHPTFAQACAILKNDLLKLKAASKPQAS